MSVDSLARWMASDAASCGAVVKAEAEMRFLGVVARTAVSGNWQAAAWWLERRRHASYGRRDRVDMTLDVRREAERIAAETGLDVADILAEAEAIMSGRGR